MTIAMPDGVYNALIHFAGYAPSPISYFYEMIAIAHESDWTIDEVRELAKIFDHEWSGNFEELFDQALEEYSASQ